LHDIGPQDVLQRYGQGVIALLRLCNSHLRDGSVCIRSSSHLLAAERPRQLPDVSVARSGSAEFGKQESSGSLHILDWRSGITEL
jgi:hypothetical protein